MTSNLKEELKNTSNLKEESKNTSNLTGELEFTKKELVYTKSELELVEDKLSYCQDRLLDIRNEKDNLLKKYTKYESLNVEMKLEEAELLKHDYLKQKHRLEITKEYLDESRNEVALLKEVIEDFKNTKNIDFIRNRYPNSYNLYTLRYDKYNPYDKYNSDNNDK